MFERQLIDPDCSQREIRLTIRERRRLFHEQSEERSFSSDQLFKSVFSSSSSHKPSSRKRKKKPTTTTKSEGERRKCNFPLVQCLVRRTTMMIRSRWRTNAQRGILIKSFHPHHLCVCASASFLPKCEDRNASLCLFLHQQQQQQRRYSSRTRQGSVVINNHLTNRTQCSRVNHRLRSQSNRPLSLTCLSLHFRTSLSR